jgi:succinate dehydrogenase/fumarate reductase cytochrome b subunit
MDVGYGGLFGILVLAGDIWAILNIAQSGASNGKKLVWILVVLLLPLLGLIVWFLAGPRSGKT